MRVVSGDHWAEVSEEPYTWGQKNRIKDSVRHEGFTPFKLKLVTERVTSWSEAGEPSDPAAWDPVDNEFGEAVFGAALKTWAAVPDPNAPSGDGSSSPSPLASPSETPTPS
jgi:hypothetical protein